MKLYKQITVDLYNNFPIVKIDAQQKNIGRGVIVTLTANEEVVDAAGEDIKIWAKRPDGKISYLQCEVLNDRKIKADFSSQMLSVEGTVLVSLELISGEDDITSPLFEINVGKNIADHNAAESQNEFSALQRALSEVNEIGTSDTKNNTVSFTSEDTDALTEFMDVELLKSGEKHSSILKKVSKMFGNIRKLIFQTSEQNESIGNIEKLLGNDTTIFEFSENVTYEAGKYCIKDNVLYKFLSNKIPGEWSESIVREVDIISELDNNWKHVGSISTSDTNKSLACSWKEEFPSIKEIMVRCALAEFPWMSITIPCPYERMQRHSTSLYYSEDYFQCIAIEFDQQRIGVHEAWTTGNSNGQTLGPADFKADIYYR